MSKIHKFSLTWDTDYGIDRRTGWTLCINGSVLVELERSLLRCLWKAYRRWRKLEQEYESV